VKIILDHRKRLAGVVSDDRLEQVLKECERDIGSVIEFDKKGAMKGRIFTQVNINCPLGREKTLSVECKYGTMHFREGAFSIDFEKKKQLEFVF
jgi:hypothetical protein